MPTRNQTGPLQVVVLMTLLDNDSRCMGQLEAEFGHHGPLAVRKAVGQLTDAGLADVNDDQVRASLPVRYLDILGVVAL